MEEIVRALESLKGYYIQDISRISHDIERENKYVENSKKVLADLQERLDEAQAFIDQYDEAIAKLRA